VGGGGSPVAIVCNAVHPGFVKTELTRHKEAEFGTVRRFSAGLYTQRCHWFPRLLA
jgi:hypothetical protein